MITVSLCEIKPLYLCREYAQVTLQEVPLRQVESKLPESGSWVFIVLLGKTQNGVKIYTQKARYQAPTT